MITFREALPNKRDYARLFSTTGWNQTYKASDEELAAAISNSWKCVSAYDEYELVGFGRIVSDGVLYAVLFDIIIAPAFQRRGIGSEICKRLIQFCQQAGIRDIQLFSSMAGHPFYQRLGFEDRPANAPGMKLKPTYYS